VSPTTWNKLSPDAHSLIRSLLHKNPKYDIHPILLSDFFSPPLAGTASQAEQP
jgi:hypothetical protein